MEYLYADLCLLLRDPSHVGAGLLNQLQDVLHDVKNEIPEVLVSSCKPRRWHRGRGLL
jgi:hypothetical protein